MFIRWVPFRSFSSTPRPPAPSSEAPARIQTCLQRFSLIENCSSVMFVLNSRKSARPRRESTPVWRTGARSLVRPPGSCIHNLGFAPFRNLKANYFGREDPGGGRGLPPDPWANGGCNRRGFGSRGQASGEPSSFSSVFPWVLNKFASSDNGMGEITWECFSARRSRFDAEGQLLNQLYTSHHSSLRPKFPGLILGDGICETWLPCDLLTHFFTRTVASNPVKRSAFQIS